jgi:hydrogenase maturation protein HypF
MTSANIRGNPILKDNQLVREKLGHVADHFLFHNRDIHIQCDDSVLNTIPLTNPDKRRTYPIRRSRGYTPQPLNSPLSGGSLLAVGAELKNTFCHLKESYLFLSQHLGDLKNLSTLESFQRSVDHFERLFRIEPALLVYDTHPDYLSTRYALDRAKGDNIPCLEVQHHHAHIASCLADNQDLGEQPVIGLAYDGIGYGDDQAIWGGEILVADYRGYQRVGHLAYFPLPGGDLAVREPWRCALGLLDHLGLDWDEDLPPIVYAQSLPEALPGVHPLQALQGQLKSGTNCPSTSSMGRLFDAAASLLGIRHIISYEGQAAIELEALVDPTESGRYPLQLSKDNQLSPAPLIEGIIKDIRNQVGIPRVAARFHNSLAALSLEAAQRVKTSHQLTRVALSGGVWQNISLLTKTYQLLTQAGFEVLLHRNIPPNDGGLSLGQALIGQSFLSREE